MATKETATRVFGPFNEVTPPGKLIAQLNGGTMTVDYRIDDTTPEFVTHKTITEDGAYDVSISRAAIRISVSGGAAFSFDPQKETA